MFVETNFSLAKLFAIDSNRCHQQEIMLLDPDYKVYLSIKPTVLLASGEKLSMYVDGVILIKHNSSPISQIWPLLGVWFLQFGRRGAAYSRWYLDSTITVFGWRCREWPAFHHQKPFALGMDRFCYDSQMEAQLIRNWLLLHQNQSHNCLKFCFSTNAFLSNTL